MQMFMLLVFFFAVLTKMGRREKRLFLVDEMLVVVSRGCSWHWATLAASWAHL